MKRIKIEWNHCFEAGDDSCTKCFVAPGGEIEGIATIGQGSEERGVVITISKGFTTIKPVKGDKVLPELTTEEDRLIRLMAEAYLAGMSREITVTHWTVQADYDLLVKENDRLKANLSKISVISAEVSGNG